jgi:hypothetical protein
MKLQNHQCSIIDAERGSLLMTSVLDDQSNVVLASKSDTSNHVVGPCDVDRVAGVIAQFTRLRC